MFLEKISCDHKGTKCYGFNIIHIQDWIVITFFNTQLIKAINILQI